MILALCEDLEPHMDSGSLMALAVIVGRIVAMLESKKSRASNVRGLRQTLTLHKSYLNTCQEWLFTGQ